MPELLNHKIAIIGLGYVGLPLAIEFGKKYKTVGFDININRIKELKKGIDSTLEISEIDLLNTTFLSYTNNIEDIKKCTIFIITVPTPVDKYNRPDLTPLYKASETVSKLLKINDVVIYESTVYPGATEEECMPVLEKNSGLKFNKDFFCGYSPERINPGDKIHRLTDIKKITAGSTPATAAMVDALYNSIIKAGTYKAASIKIAEAAKVIENAQRDINIAFVNELAKIFNKLNIDTQQVLEAASTKWNFLPFKPGLVGGHCIGVDPYYLAQKAQEVGYHPEIILAGRRLNDEMGIYIANEVIKLIAEKGLPIKNAKILILGITFKENCPDIRNSRVIDVIRQLQSYYTIVHVYDPWANKKEVTKEYSIEPKSLKEIENVKYDAIVLAVAHKEFLQFNIDKYKQNGAIIYDIKSFLPLAIIDKRL